MKTIEEQLEQLHKAYIQAEADGDHNACERVSREINELQNG